MALRTADDIAAEHFPLSGSPETRYAELRDRRLRVLQAWTQVSVTGSEIEVRNPGLAVNFLVERGYKRGMMGRVKRVRNADELRAELRALNESEHAFAADERVIAAANS